ncbi:OmpA family protein [Nesterenkonia suensis]
MPLGQSEVEERPRETEAPAIDESDGDDDAAPGAEGERVEDDGDGSGDAGDDEGRHDEGAGVGDRLVAEVGDPIDIAECEPGEGYTVTMLDDVVIEEQVFPGTDPEVIEIDGEEIEIPGAPEIVIPERVAQAGCLIEHEAPGACLPRVEISSAYIPAVTLPERVLPEVELPDGAVLEEVAQDALELAAVEVDGVVADQVCQQEAEDAESGDWIWSVYRWSVYRWSEYQWSERQWSERRGSTSGDDWRVSTMTLETVTAETLALPTVKIPTEKLETYRLDDAEHTERTDDDDRTAYITESDVLFDPDEYEVRAEAEGDLRAIAEDIAARDDDYAITVEGHTDDVPTEEYDDNQELSELRADSVRDWLIEEADVDADVISAEGLGEDVPRADNATEEGRAENRRVVITVKPTGRETEPDYEIGDEDEEE